MTVQTGDSLVAVWWQSGSAVWWALSRCIDVGTSGCVVVYRRGHFRGVQPWTLLAAWWRTAVDTFEVYSRGHFWLRGTGGVQPWTLSRCTDVDTSGDIDIATGM